MIRFGTSGWRAIISDEFTFRNVRLLVQAITNVVLDDPLRESQVVVGYDTRFLSARMAREAASVLSAGGVRAFLCARDAPTGAVSLEVIARRAAGAIYFTASQNPPEYNGLKYFDANGAPAPSELTDRIEMEVVRLESHGFDERPQRDDELVTMIDPQEPYLAHLQRTIAIDRIRGCGLRLAVDVLYGTSREYLDRLLVEGDCAAQVIHNFADPYFGGYSPECSAPNLRELAALVRESGADVGLATDGDGDRFGVVSPDGELLPADDVVALLVDYLAADRGLAGTVARTVATSHLVDRVAARHGLGVEETPVGFKYVGARLVSGAAAVGVEQSAGFGLASHLPEKDGILACLLVAEMLAARRRPLAEERERLWREHGRLFHQPATLALEPGLEAALAEVVGSPPDRFAGRRVERVHGVDGVKLVLEGGSWFLVRRSGTEPAVRLYAEAASEVEVERLLVAGRELLAKARPAQG